MQEQNYHSDYLSPLGWIEIKSSTIGIQSLKFVEEKPSPTAKENEFTLQCKKELDAYFKHELQHFDVPLDPKGSEFQQKVWKALKEIPYGTTTSYGKLADLLGDRYAVRAVGKANGKNPIAIIIPCHRVIGASGNLTGYAWGLERKQALLKLEKAPFQTCLF